MTPILINLLLIGSIITAPRQTGCYDFVKSIVKKESVVQAVLVSSELNNISPALLLGYLACENSRFENLPLNSSGDVGLFQININYHPYSVETLMDVRKNAIIAGQIIRENLSTRPDIFGLGQYHSSTPKRNVRYRERLLRRTRKILKLSRDFQCE
ncbi:MAG: hypothetical protein ACE5FU_01275 [Nitrospinota bacterium]